VPSPISVTASAAPSRCPLSHNPYSTTPIQGPLADERIPFNDGSGDYFRSPGVVEGPNKSPTPGGLNQANVVVTGSKGTTGSAPSRADAGAGSLADVPRTESSLGHNLANHPTLTTDSPAVPGALSPPWNNTVLYEFLIDSSVFAGTTFDINALDGIVPSTTHASPSCFANDPIVTILPEPSTLALLGFAGLGILGCRRFWR